MKLKQKLISAILAVTMLMGYASTLTNAVIAVGTNLAGQNSKTNHANVEFNSYFDEEQYSKTFKMGEEAKLYLKVKVSNTGYLKNGIVQFASSNFEVDTKNLNNDMVQSCSKTEIKLKQINNSSNEVIIEVPITMVTGETVDSDLFDKITTVKFTGTYMDENGKEKSIEKEISNEAKWKGTAEAELAGQVTKYIPYEIGEEKGVLVQAKVRSELKDNSLPVAKTKLEVDIPEIKISENKAVVPERVTVVANTTKATNGKGSYEFNEENYKYNEETNKIEIEVTNNEENGKISWSKNAVDEYMISYIYTGEEVYSYVQAQLEKAKETVKTEEEKEKGQVNENAITGKINIKSTIEAYNSEETKLEKEGTINYTIEKAIGDMVDASISSTNTISKGYIYANYAKAEKQAKNETIEAKKDTDFEVKYTAQISDKTITDAVEFESVSEKYIDNDGKEYSSKVENSESIYSKTVKISEAVFNKMLGEEGKIEITSKAGKKLAEITKDTEKDQSGNYIVNIEDAKVNEIIIKTSKPITEGNIEISVEKVISAEQGYDRDDMEDFEKITLGVIAKSYTNVTKTTQTTLAEPVSKAEISIGTQNLSTVVKNEDVELRVVLDTSSNENALYKNPVLQVVMPKNIEKLDVKSVDLLLDDELKVKNTKVEEQNGRKVILITLEGTQTQYMDNGTSKAVEGQNVIAKGANIVIKADITFKKLTPSASTNILLYYTNNNSNLYESTNLKGTAKTVTANNVANSQTLGVATTEVEVVAPSGVAIENYMSGYNDNGSISNITAEEQVETIKANETAKDVTIGGTIVNNYSNAIENVSVLGRTPFAGNKQIDGTEELGSSFTMAMKSKITTSGINSDKVKVYYSTNGEATKDLTDASNAWTESPSSLAEVKSYLVVITDEMTAGTQLKFEYKAELPENLTYANSTYTTYKVYYNNKIDDATLSETKEAGTIGLTTGDEPDLSVELKSTIGTIREGQTVRMLVTVKNNGSETATNVKVNIPVPDGAKLMEYVEGVGFYDETETTKVITIGSIKAGETKQAEYYIKFNVSENTSNYPKEVSHKVTVTADDLTEGITSDAYKFSVQEGKISTSIVITNMEDGIIKKGDHIEYMIPIRNISSDSELTNVTITVPLPNGMKYVSAKITDALGSSNTYDEEIKYDETSNVVSINISKIDILRIISLQVDVQENVADNMSTIVTAQADGTEIHYSNVLGYSAETIDINLEVSELTSTPRYVKEGEEVTYTLKLTNNSNVTLTGVKVEDILPEGLTFVEANYTQGSSKVGMTAWETEGSQEIKIDIGSLTAGESTTINLVAKADILPDTNDKEVKNNMTITADNYEGTTTNTVTNIIEYYKPTHDKATGSDSEDNQTGTSTGGNLANRYKITGTAWVDSDKDGKRSESEKLLPNVQVVLINKANSQLVTDADTGAQKITTTNDKGQYEFSNLTAGEYLVVFLYDAGKYSITEYQAKTVDASYNSDAINMKITLNGEQRYAGVTDTIKITNENVRDIDIGVYVAEKFDLRLDKYISKITMTTPTSGTKVYNYENSKLTKRELYGKDVNSSSIVVEYKIVVTNEGQIPGYAKKIIDYLPEDVKFSSELNKDWYISNDNQVAYNTSLENVKIEPGESKEVTLILSISITDKNVGTMINNNAEIYESYNEQGMQDYDSQEANRLESEDDMSSADIMISIATGKIVIYTTLVLAIVMLLGFGVFEIKRRILDKREK